MQFREKLGIYGSNWPSVACSQVVSS